MAKEKKEIILSGIQPTGTFTLGNYIGAVSRWPKLESDFETYYFIANLHAITVRQDPAALKKRSLEAFALLLACGISPDKSLVFMQSHIKEHSEAAWILECYTYFGELARMIQFKEKSEKSAENNNAGLFVYPALMSADILLYGADFVPVGEDQQQHLELTRDVAARFNALYGDVFKIPKAHIAEFGARIMSLKEPTKKMSKSDSDKNATVDILEEKDKIIKKFKSAVTDSEMEIRYAQGKDGINNLMTIYSSVTNKTNAEIEKDFAGKGYGDFKVAVGEAVADHLAPVREEFSRLMDDRAYLDELMLAGAEKARIIAGKTLRAMKDALGIL